VIVSYRLFGMDVGFYNSIGVYPLETRCEMLADLGYDATNLTLWSDAAWSDLPKLGSAASSSGLSVACINVTVDLSAPTDRGETARILDMIERIEATDTVELALRFDAVQARGPDAAADRFLDAALEAAQRNDVKLLLYPHAHFWLERVADAVRLCAHYDTERLCMTFSAFHWYAVDGENLCAQLRAAGPYLRQVNTSGSRRVSGQYLPATIEPVGDGEFDNFAFLGMLRELGFDGLLGVQGYGVGGDVYSNLRRSLEAIREAERRLDKHPHWARMRFDSR